MEFSGRGPVIFFFPCCRRLCVLVSGQSVAVTSEACGVSASSSLVLQSWGTAVAGTSAVTECARRYKPSESLPAEITAIQPANSNTLQR